MKLVLCALLLVACGRQKAPALVGPPFTPTGASIIPAVADENEFDANGHHYKLTTNIDEKSLSYSVLKNSEAEVSGNLAFCRRADTSRDPGFTFRPLTIGTQTVGVLLGVVDECTDKIFTRYALFVPGNPIASFISKQKPVAVSKGSTLDLWSAFQQWSTGGVGDQYLIPQRILIDPSLGPRALQTVVKLDPAFENWPPEMARSKNFPALFMAGVSELNAPLLQAAYLRSYSESDQNLYAQLGLPARRHDVESQIATVLRARDAFYYFLKK